MIIISGPTFCRRVITRAIFSMKELVYLFVSARTFKQQIFQIFKFTLHMVFIKHKSLKPDTFFNPIFIPCFSGFEHSRIQVFQGPGFLGFGSRFFRVEVFQGPGPSFRSSLKDSSKRGPKYFLLIIFYICFCLYIKMLA